MRPGVRRLIVKLTHCTLAGAVVTWAVAWGCALWSGFSLDREFVGFQFRDGRPAIGMVNRGLFSESWLLQDASLPGAWFTSASLKKIQKDPPRWAREPVRVDAVHVTFAYGYPAFCMSRSCEFTQGPQSTTATSDEIVVHVGGNEGSLPLRIIPLGFALNTLLSAGLLLGVTEGLGFARRRVRARKGQCPACGYDRRGLAGNTACPECGGGGKV